MGAEQSSVGGLSTEEAERELELAALDKAARVAQAFFRGHLARKDCRLLRTKGELLMRTNLPAGWRAEDGVPAGLEIEERRHVSFIDNHLLVSRTHFGCFASAVSVADFVLHTTCVQRVFTDPTQPTVFALGMDTKQRDVLFRAPDVQTRDRWLRAISDAATRSAVKLASDDHDR
ncbi:hypothetical protein KFE25_004326 [Diacronema lutheri]|uniref:PH domain-containing protein n=1 Tax=Diacronema lutheri TaxID=2081491 RepID=A0A8J5X3H4_DIALT|nr:hypothetical protein KFE25_004326 [Diacronema lutheri]|mmetsp:Transcript_18449/g.57471  ORF Transcript_18449/g.57471 Transcript_18449/m.57471 type:complete len:175 (-) Transcript_18449:130-654(-)